MNVTSISDVSMHAMNNVGEWKCSCTNSIPLQ